MALRGQRPWVTCHFLFMVRARWGEIKEEEVGERIQKGPRRVRRFLLTPRNLGLRTCPGPPPPTAAPHPRCIHPFNAPVIISGWGTWMGMLGITPHPYLSLSKP